MPARTENGCLWITHSKYYYQWIGGLPYAPFDWFECHLPASLWCDFVT